MTGWDSEALVAQVLQTYEALNYQPNPGQFTVMAAFVLVLEDRSLVISLATGTKCLPTNRFSPQGEALHDSHAEVLARRGATRWFIQEVIRCCRSDSVLYESPWITRSHNGLSDAFALRPSVQVCFYVSALPCGDASTTYVASLQSPEMAALKNGSPPSALSDTTARGRNNYGLLSILRTKPGRSDSPSTLCMSCSDKIARWSILGILGALGSGILHPIYIDKIIIGEVPSDRWGVIAQECRRAFVERIQGVTGLPPQYKVANPRVRFVATPFIHSRTAQSGRSHSDTSLLSVSPLSSNESLCFVSDSREAKQILINGIPRGVSPKHRFREKSRAILSKIALFALYKEARVAIGLAEISMTTTYHSAKMYISHYQIAKSRLRGHEGPFSGWVCSGIEWESFCLQDPIGEDSVEKGVHTPK